MPFSPSKLTAMHLAIGSIFISLVVLAMKYAAYLLTHSVGLYSDALETVVNLAAAIGVVIAVWLSAKPADDNHPFGHHKAEYLSAVAEGVFIVLAALSIFREAYAGFMNPRLLDIHWLGLSLNAGAGVVNGIWAAVLVRQGTRMRSPALIADGKHLFTDIVSSVGVLAGVGIAALTGLHWLDPLLAFAVGVSILWTGWGLLKGSMSGLMDEAIDEEEQEQIRTIIMANADGAIEAHDLKTRHSGRVIFVEFHLVVPSAMSVDTAHAICDRIEHALMDNMPHADVIIHIEPEDKAHEPHSEGSMVF
ncbi:cation diffusion facilitator family transporter [Cohaesibacter sp. CAU 1516]|uniref:cation diffusion facilitator family transporter n=1 Tax=Cohaesibacter sp. CAU 1516 TaxID=2576038 RepID=UPI001485B5F9|nr:cation diffusion facilitator family transporter [Cohaesibacter sp. CAU 1516]